MGSITVCLTPRWVCVTTWICKYWGGPIIGDLTPSWGPVTTQIYISLEEWPKDWVLLQLIWPHVGVVLQLEFVNINGVLIYSWPDPKLGSCYNTNLLFSGRMTQELGSITFHLTPRWGCVTKWICLTWWGPKIVHLTQSWGPVTTQIYFYYYYNPTLGLCYNLNLYIMMGS